MSDTDTPSETPHDSSGHSIHDGQGTYDVVLLVEQALSPADAAQVRSLHSEIEDQVLYHVLLPLEDAAARIEASLGTLGAGDLMAAPALAMNDVDIEALRKECEDTSNAEPGRPSPRSPPPAAQGHRQGHLRAAGRRPRGARDRGRRPRGDHPHPPARRGRVLPRRLDLARPAQARRTGPPPHRARELRRAGLRHRRGRQRPLTSPSLVEEGALAPVTRPLLVDPGLVTVAARPPRPASRRGG